MELFEKKVKAFQPLTIFTKSSILDVQLGSEHAFANTLHNSLGPYIC